MKHCIQTLPEGYREIQHVTMQDDKKTALVINGIGFAATLLMLGVGQFFVPVKRFFSMDDGMAAYWLRLLVMLGGTAAYLVLHELTHAAAMKHYGAGKLRFGFTGMYAYAGSEGDYFDKTAYRVIALAPLVVWTVLLTVPLVFVPQSWFWNVYFIQIANIAGAAGDVYVTVRFSRLKDTIWVKDTGIEMIVYDKA